jgi:hypothetical protein
MLPSVSSFFCSKFVAGGVIINGVYTDYHLEDIKNRLKPVFYISAVSVSGELCPAIPGTQSIVVIKMFITEPLIIVDRKEVSVIHQTVGNASSSAASMGNASSSIVSRKHGKRIKFRSWQEVWEMHQLPRLAGSMGNASTSAAGRKYGKHIKFRGWLEVWEMHQLPRLVGNMGNASTSAAGR